MNQYLRQQAEELGRGKVRTVLHTATVLHDGWESDNRAWIVEFEDGTRAALTTNHGSVCFWSKQEAEQSVAEAEASAASIRKAMDMWPNG